MPRTCAKRGTTPRTVAQVGGAHASLCRGGGYSTAGRPQHAAPRTPTRAPGTLSRRTVAACGARLIYRLHARDDSVELGSPFNGCRDVQGTRRHSLYDVARGHSPVATAAQPRGGRGRPRYSPWRKLKGCGSSVRGSITGVYLSTRSYSRPVGSSCATSDQSRLPTPFRMRGAPHARILARGSGRWFPAQPKTSLLTARATP